MIKSVVINLGAGDLNSGFPRVTAQLREAGHPLPQQFTGSLPPAPVLAELYQNWQLVYRSLSARKELLSPPAREEDDDELEIDEGGITNVSQLGFEEVCKKLEESLNAWLKSKDFIHIEQQLRAQLNTAEEIRVIVETGDELLRRFPWHCWDFFSDYPKAEMALSRPEYKRTQPSQPKAPREKVRILAVLGNSSGINLETESRFLKNLPDAEVEFLVKPSRQQLNTQLWNDQGWDILFFAGHSQTEGETGRLYINENKTNNSLTVGQLEEALTQAIENGLKLAIFNSCDGLGLALALEKLNLPAVIVMREPVPNRVAQEFCKHFLEAFAQKRLPLYLAAQQARRKLQGLENDFPGASWLPVICQNPAVEPATWLQLGGIPPCPYRGLFAFREEDAHLFFGREPFAEDLVAAVKKKPLVAAIGASGSGKSSVMFAGTLPKLRKDTLVHWQIVSFRPGKNPFDALAVALAPSWERLQQPGESGDGENARRLIELELAISLKQDPRALYKIIESLVQQNPGTRLILIADQFEELYTQNPESERQPFLDALLTAVKRGKCCTFLKTAAVQEIGQIFLASEGQGQVAGMSVTDGNVQIVDTSPLAPLVVNRGRVTALLTALWAGGREEGLLRQAAASYFYFRKKGTALTSNLNSVAFTNGLYLRAEKKDGEPLYAKTSNFLEFLETWGEARQLPVAIKSHEPRLLRVKASSAADGEVGSRWCSSCSSKTGNACRHRVAAHLWAVENGWGGLQGFLTPSPLTQEMAESAQLCRRAGTSSLLRIVTAGPNGVIAKSDGGSRHTQFYPYGQLWCVWFEDIKESVASSAKVQMPRMVPV
ncbi:nSTAND1 domain-containing NTPase [Kamptonema formosum]|uniref:nSTAND1 domain-containing NTPase n=1 Tax=Kamptonema formosum TaxID=331992 RepID=UPI00036520BF|nr:CHAT domain-containing protein [Oscillatoria sp. PCC 10802]